MDAAAALAALRDAGTEPGALRTVAEQIGVDHELALALWASGGADAQGLATLVADPLILDGDTSDTWAAASRSHVLADLVGELVSRSPIALDRMSQWIGARDEWTARSGWAVMSQLALFHPDVPDAAFTPYLAIIERRVHEAPRRVREAMNQALFSIGGRSRELAELAIAAAQRIGVVKLDEAPPPGPTKTKPAAKRKTPARATKRPAPRRTKRPAR
jgi:3-methyladenine DNA glycosylase AlkD